jgi:hypothetical protein
MWGRCHPLDPLAKKPSTMLDMCLMRAEFMPNCRCDFVYTFHWVLLNSIGRVILSSQYRCGGLLRYLLLTAQLELVQSF